MSDWKNELQNFLAEKGLNKTVQSSKMPVQKQELNEQDEKIVLDFVEQIVVPVFKNLSVEIGTFQDMSARVELSRKPDSNVLENIDLRVLLMLQTKLVYKFSFEKENDQIFVIGQYSLTDLYGSPTGFESTGMKELLAELNAEKIISDFMHCFTAKFKIK